MNRQVSPLKPLPTQAGDITLVQQLESTPGITTFLGKRGAAGESVVVRHLDLRTTQSWNSDWLVRDLDVLAQVPSHHLVTTSVVEIGPDEALLVRQFVTGRDIREWATKRPAVTLEACVGVFRQLFAGLAELHRQGIVHGGLQAANVFVSGDDSRLLLTDALVTRTQLAGPELLTAHPWPVPPGAGQSHRQVGFFADIRAAGWLVLECLADRAPGLSALPVDASTRTSSGQIAQLVDAVGVPTEYQAIVNRLLSPVPEVCYPSAEHVVAAIDGVALTRDRRHREPPAEHSPARLVYLNPPLVGRQSEFGMLKAYVDRLTAGHGSVVCLTGEPGIGKTRLLDAVASHAEASQVRVLRAGAFHHTAQRPLGLFTGLFADLVELLLAHPEQAARVRDELGDLVMPIAGLVPELAKVFPAVSPAGRPGSWAADAATSAAVRLLHCVFGELGPGLLVLDDCQWADVSSLHLLAKIAAAVSGDDGTPLHLTMVCSFRTDGVAEVTSWGDHVEFLEVGPLGLGQAQELVRAVAGDVSEELLQYIVGHSAGNPLGALTVFRALVDSSHLRLEGGAWVLAEDGLHGLPSVPWPDRQLRARRPQETTNAASFVLARVDGLPVETVGALCQASVLGRRFATGALSSALGVDTDQCDLLLKEAVDRGIVRSRPMGSTKDLEFTHDQLRDAVLDSLSEASRRELHARAASAQASAAVAADDYEVAYHYDQSGDAAAALPYALRAAEAALAQNFLDVAQTNFKIAESGVAALEQPDDATRLRALEGLGTVHMLRGNYDTAETLLSAAYEIAGSLSGLEAARIAVLLEELSFKDGRIEDAEVWRSRATQSLGVRFPRTSLGLVCAFALEVVRLLLSCLDRRRPQGRTPEAVTRDQLRARLYTRLMYEGWFSRSRLWITCVALRAFRCTRRSGNTNERAQTYSAVAVILSGFMPPLAGLGLRFAERSLRWRQEAQDRWGIAQSQHFRGFVLHCGGRYNDAIEAFDEAIETFETMGDRWEEFAARWEKALCLYRMGRLHEAGALARETYHAAKRIGDRIAAGTALAIWTRCLPDEVSSELIRREISLIGPADHHTQAVLSGALGWRLFNDEQYTAAADALETTTRAFRRAGIRNLFVAPIITWRLQILRLWCDATPAWLPKERRRRGRAARRQLRRALCTAVVFHSERPAVLREWAILCFSRGRGRRGRWILGRALRASKRLGSEGEIAACLFVVDAVSQVPDGDALRSSRSLDPELCRRLRIRVHRGVVEASTLELEPVVAGNSAMQQEFPDTIRRIVSATSPDDILAELRAASYALTPARSVVLTPTSRAREGDGPFEAPEHRAVDRLAIPVVAFSVAAALMEVEFPEGRADDFAMTLEVLAGLAGAVLEREELRKESLERIVAVQEAERGRVARDLHDEFGSLFTGILNGAAVLDELADNDARQVAEDVRRIAMEGIHAVRSVAWGLRPAGLEHFGLPGCVEQFVEDCARRSGIRIELTTDGDVWSALPAEVETGLFRIIQEALTNIDRHSSATEASVLLVASAAGLRAIIEDNGEGFDLDDSEATSSLGIMGMRERARLLGGRVTLESRRGRGTTVLVEVPLRP